MAMQTNYNIMHKQQMQFVRLTNAQEDKMCNQEFFHIQRMNWLSCLQNSAMTTLQQQQQPERYAMLASENRIPIRITYHPKSPVVLPNIPSAYKASSMLPSLRYHNPENCIQIKLCGTPTGYSTLCQSMPYNKEGNQTIWHRCCE